MGVGNTYISNPHYIHAYQFMKDLTDSLHQGTLIGNRKLNVQIEFFQQFPFGYPVFIVALNPVILA